MAEITASMVKELREATGLGMMECKLALTETDGNFDKAMDLLRNMPAPEPKLVLNKRMQNAFMDLMDIPRFHMPEPEPRRQ